MSAIRIFIVRLFFAVCDLDVNTKLSYDVGRSYDKTYDKFWREYGPWYREILSQSLKSLQPMLSQWGYRNICKSTCNLLAEVPAGSRINFEEPAFASKAILRKKTYGCCGQTPSSTFYTFHWITPTFWKKLIFPLKGLSCFRSCKKLTWFSTY